MNIQDIFNSLKGTRRISYNEIFFWFRLFLVSFWGWGLRSLFFLRINHLYTNVEKFLFWIVFSISSGFENFYFDVSNIGIIQFNFWPNINQKICMIFLCGMVLLLNIRFDVNFMFFLMIIYEISFEFWK